MLAKIVGPGGRQNRIMALSIQNMNSTQTRDYHEKPYKEGTYHWPYEKKSYTLANFWQDPFTKKKFNERSKIIQVEGNIFCGKQDFAKRLANELGMKYMPPVELDSHYVNLHGYDYRALNPLLPERLRMACDWEMYHENPARLSAIYLQNNLFKLRVFQYIKALQHLFNTGQGVVLGRSAFTERVFVEAAHNIGWLPMGYLRGDGLRFYDWKLRYLNARNLVLVTLLRPHLTIYLDTPVEICLEKAKNSGDPMIRESKAMVPEFLEGIEQAYKEIVLPKQALNGHLLAYDYLERATDDEIMDVVDDIKKLDFNYDWKDTKFETWDYEQQKLWFSKRRNEFTSNECLDTFKYFNAPYYDIAGMGDCVTDADLKMRGVLYECHVGPFGYSTDIQHDRNYTNVISAFFGRTNFGDFLESWIRSDFR